MRIMRIILCRKNIFETSSFNIRLTLNPFYNSLEKCQINKCLQGVNCKLSGPIIRLVPSVSISGVRGDGATLLSNGLMVTQGRGFCFWVNHMCHGQGAGVIKQTNKWVIGKVIVTRFLKKATILDNK